MKILTLCHLILFPFLYSKAQIKSNKTLIGTELSYYSYKLTNQDSSFQKQKQTAIEFTLGKAIAENKVLGIILGYFQNFTSVSQNYDTIITNNPPYEFGLFYREYKTLAKDLYFYSEIDGIYIKENDERNYSAAIPENTSKIRYVSLSLRSGIAYQLYKKVQLELSLPNLLNLQYQHTKNINPSNPSANSKEDILFLSSALNNYSALGNIGVGFRVIF